MEQLPSDSQRVPLNSGRRGTRWGLLKDGPDRGGRSREHWHCTELGVGRVAWLPQTKAIRGRPFSSATRVMHSQTFVRKGLLQIGTTQRYGSESRPSDYLDDRAGESAIQGQSVTTRPTTRSCRCITSAVLIRGRPSHWSSPGAVNPPRLAILHPSDCLAPSSIVRGISVHPQAFHDAVE